MPYRCIVHDLPSDSWTCQICGFELEPSRPTSTGSVTSKKSPKTMPDLNSLETPLPGDTPQATNQPKTLNCPSQWLIEGREPNNWRKHLAAVALEAKQIKSESQGGLLAAILAGDTAKVLRHLRLGKALISQTEHEKLGRQIRATKATAKIAAKAAVKSRRTLGNAR